MDSLKLLLYRNYLNIVEGDFQSELKGKLQNISKNYESFEQAFLATLNIHVPDKKKLIRANHKPYVTKQLRKAIMMRSNLENKFYKNRSPAKKRALKKQRNFCNRLYKRERRKYFSQLNLDKITGNEKFWSTVKPPFANKGGRDNIILVTGEMILKLLRNSVSFSKIVQALNITENKLPLTSTNDVFNGVDESINKFQKHPSIMSMDENVSVDDRFSFLEINAEEIHLQIRSLKNNKASTFMNIPAKL